MKVLLDEKMSDALRRYHQRQDRIAFELLLPLAQLGLPEAQYRLGKVYLRGCVTTQTESILRLRAVQWMERATRRGHPLAKFELTSLGVPSMCPVIAPELKHLDPEVQLVNVEVLTAYASFLADDQSRTAGPASKPLALESLRLAADGGLVEAMRDLGQLYWSAGDKVNAIGWTTRAATQHSVQAQYSLGLWYATDSSLHDAHKAEHYYHLSAAAGSSEGLFNLAQMHLDSLDLNSADADTMRDIAVSYVGLAAIQESEEAQLYLARVYERGELVGKNSELSAFWRNMADGWVLRNERQALTFATLVADLDRPVT